MHVLQLYIEGLCHGNLLEEEAISISHIFKTNFSVPPLPIEMRHQEQIIDLPSGANLVRDVGVKNKLEKNSVVEVTETGYFGITSMFPSSLISFIGLLWQLCSFFFFLCYLFLIDFALQLYFQIEQEIGMESIKLKALLDLFDEIVEEPLFNQLR